MAPYRKFHLFSKMKHLFEKLWHRFEKMWHLLIKTVLFFVHLCCSLSIEPIRNKCLTPIPKSVRSMMPFMLTLESRCSPVLKRGDILTVYLISILWLLWIYLYSPYHTSRYQHGSSDPVWYSLQANILIVQKLRVLFDPSRFFMILPRSSIWIRIYCFT